MPQAHASAILPFMIILLSQFTISSPLPQVYAVSSSPFHCIVRAILCTFFKQVVSYTASHHPTYSVRPEVLSSPIRIPLLLPYFHLTFM